MVPIIGGRLGDDRGRRPMLLIGIARLRRRSARRSGWRRPPGVLIAGRVLQGLAGGLLNPQVSGLVQQLFPRARARPGVRPDRHRGRRRHRRRARCVGGVIIALGGADVGWRLCFLVNVPVGHHRRSCCAGPGCPRPPPAGARRPLDLPGAALLARRRLRLLFPAVQFDASHDPRLALLLLPALAVLAAFVSGSAGPRRAARLPADRPRPLQDPLLRRRGRAGAAVLLRATPARRWCSPCSCRTASASPRCTSGLTASAYAVGRDGGRTDRRPAAAPARAAGAGRRRWCSFAVGRRPARRRPGRPLARQRPRRRVGAAARRAAARRRARRRQRHHAEPGAVAGRGRRRAAARPRAAPCRRRSASATRSARP